MSEELFSVPEAKSPRLKWKERHNVVTRQSDPSVVGLEDEFSGDEVQAWYATRTGANTEPDWTTRNVFGGATEDEAMVELARALGFGSWTEERP